MATTQTGCVFITVGLLALACGAASSASALDAFWQGRRGPVWEHGINPIGGKSNWYSQPQGGQPREVPDGKAVFTGAPQQFEVWITERTQIGTMAIRKDAPRYDFEVRPNATLVLTGIGLINASPVAARFLVRERGLLSFDNAARLISSARSAHINVHGQMFFNDTSHGGNAFVKNKGTIIFNQFATAERMTIDNGDPLSSGFPAFVTFRDNSTAGEATFVNRKNGILGFAGTRGPRDDRKVTAGGIINNSGMTLGTTTLIIEDNFVQNSSGLLSVVVEPSRSGNIIVKGSAQLAGTLDVFASAFNAPPGSYRVLRALGGRTGTFTLDSNISKSRLIYSATDVHLVVDPP